MQPRSPWRSETFRVGLAVTLLAAPVFSRLGGWPGYSSTVTDYEWHAAAGARLFQGGPLLPHPLYQLCVAALCWGNLRAAGPAAACVLALAAGARAGLSAYLFTSHRVIRPDRLVLLCLALALAMPLPNWWKFPSVYLGQVSPNVWHSPTTVLAMPFALGVFLLGMRLLAAPGLAAAAALGGVMALSALAKPNYVLAFIPCFALALPGAQRRAGLRPAGVSGQWAACFGPVSAVLGCQYRSAFGSGAGLSVAPFVAWRDYSPNVPASLLLGIAFPLAVFLLYPRPAAGGRRLALAWAVLAVAVVQFALFREEDHPVAANFAWGSVLADHVLFVASADFLLGRPPSARRLAAFSVLGLHVAAGVVCLWRCLQVPQGAGAF